MAKLSKRTKKFVTRAWCFCRETNFLVRFESLAMVGAGEAGQRDDSSNEEKEETRTPT